MHPDRNPGDEAASAERFKALSRAYEVLSNEETRRVYDKSGAEPAPQHRAYNDDMDVVVQRFMHTVLSNIDARMAGQRSSAAEEGGARRMWGTLAMGALGGLGGAAIAAARGGDSRLVCTYASLGALLGACAPVVVDSVAAALEQLDERQKTLLVDMLQELVRGLMEDGGQPSTGTNFRKRV